MLRRCTRTHRCQREAQLQGALRAEVSRLNTECSVPHTWYVIVAKWLPGHLWIMLLDCPCNVLLVQKVFASRCIVILKAAQKNAGDSVLLCTCFCIATWKGFSKSICIEFTQGNHCLFIDISSLQQ